MIIYGENGSVSFENDVFTLTLQTALGNREEQQDRCGYEADDDSGLVVVCDGMGGLSQGGRAAETAISAVLRDFGQLDPENPHKTIVDTLAGVDDTLSNLSDAEGLSNGCGTTLAAVYIHRNRFNWFSVGDSRVYLVRRNECVQITTDHNIDNILKKKISPDQLNDSGIMDDVISQPKEMLISFLGIGNLSMIDTNTRPLILQSNDKILITTDGLYKILEESEIHDILINIPNTSDISVLLEKKANKKTRTQSKARDNTTFAVIKIK